MRKLEPDTARALATKLSVDPITAPASFAIEVGGATVWRTRDSVCHVIIPKPPLRDVYFHGKRASADLLELMAQIPSWRRLVMSRVLYGQIEKLAHKGSLIPLAYYVGNGKDPYGIPPPVPGFDIRPMLHADLSYWVRFPGKADFLMEGYGSRQAVLSRGVAVGAFNGTAMATIATANVGREFAMVSVYTLPDYRKRGFAKRCIAEIVDRLRPLGIRPLFIIPPDPRLIAYRMVQQMELEKAGEQIAVMRDKLIL